MDAHRRRQQRGLSLVELLIAMTLGVLVLAALLGVFSASSRSARQTDAVSQMQDNARAALEILGRDLGMAGYWGGMYGTANLSPCALGANCGGGSPPTTTTATAANPAYECGTADVNSVPWAFQLASRLEFADQRDSGGAAATAKFPCLDSTVLQPGSDVVAIRRGAGQSAVDKPVGAATVKLVPYGFYLASNGVAGTVMRAPSSGTYPGSADPPVADNTSFYRFVPRLYYVRNYARRDASGTPDGIPTLCRAELCASGFSTNGGTTLDRASCGGGPASASGFYAECIAEGVESLQVEWGLNLNRASGADCVVDTLSSQPTAAQLAAFGLTARIFVLMRTSQIDGGYTDTRTYNFADYAMSAARGDHYHRRVYSTTVELRNPNGDSGLCTH